MFDSVTQEKIDYIKSSVSISDVLPGVKDNGTSNCPFCHGRGKLYVKNGWARCFKASCELNQKAYDVIGLYKLKNGLRGKASFFKALDELTGNRTFLESTNEQSGYLDQIANTWNFELYSKYGKQARDYLRIRGVSQELIELLKIGYARNDSILQSYGFSNKDLEDKGLFSYGKEVFSNRLTFPIRDVHGSIKCFTGRYVGAIPLDANEEPLSPRWKHSLSYKNNTASVSNYLGLEENINSYNSEYLVITEGYMDCLSLYQLGIQSCCLFGLYGLAKHINKFKKFRKVYCAFDIDTFDKDHPLFPNEYKSWRVVIPQLIDVQILCPDTTFYTFFLPGEGVSNDGSSYIAKDVNEWLTQSKETDRNKVLSLIKDSPSITQHLIDSRGMYLQHHESLLRLCISTGYDYSILDRFIPESMSKLDYAVAILSR